MNPVLKLPLEFDLIQLRQDFFGLIAEVPFHPIVNQISISVREGGGRNPFYDGVGSLHTDGHSKCSESSFSHLNPLFKNTYIEHVYNRVWEFLQLEPGRVRLMRLGPKACLSLHKDSGYRFHIALTTTTQSYLVFEKSGFFHIPADGHVYWTNTLESHTAMNGDHDLERIHLVFAQGDTEPMSASERHEFLNKIGAK